MHMKNTIFDYWLVEREAGNIYGELYVIQSTRLSFRSLSV